MATVAVRLEIVGVEVGHWCNGCMTSAGIRVWYVNLTGTRMCLHATTGCMDEDHDDVELVDQPQYVWPR